MDKTISIEGVKFDLSKAIFLNNPNNKFWEVQLDGKTVTYRAGKLNKDNKETGVDQMSKDYANEKLAQATVKTKIQDKLAKGYFLKGSEQPEKQEKKSTRSKKRQSKGQQQGEQAQKNDGYQGGLFEKTSGESVKLQTSGNKVKVTKVGEDKKQGFEIRSFKTNKQAVEFCKSEQNWLTTSEGYKASTKIFTNQFSKQEKKKGKETKSKGDKSGNLLSITDKTDQAMSHRSRALSSCKSDRSYVDTGDDNDYKTTKLGPPTSSYISVLLAQTWSDEADPQGWIMSEKLDGVRCFWTGTSMYSRNGNRFYPPKWFTKNWPKSQLDGQLFIGRGQFSKTISAIKKNVPIDSEWQKVNYLVFDCPGLKKPFKTRVKMMEQVIKQIDNDYIKCHYHRQCKGYTDLFEELEKVNKIQGEGLMLRNPDSFYQNRRSKSLLKVKTFHDDEAVILGYKEGTGRCYGMVGALKCRNTHGVEFEVGSGLNDAMRRKPPKIGTKITYKYQEFNKGSGKPRFPTFLRIYQEKI